MYQERQSEGEFAKLFPKLKKDPGEFFKYTRMTVPMFNKLLSLLEHRLQKRKTKTTLSAEERLAITLK